MPGHECFPSGWCDLSSEHRDVRRSLENLLAEAVKGNGYALTIIVAPYGSGKTTLLRHLEWYATSKLNVPAKRIELKQLVDHIVERFGIVHESELPRVVEDFAEKLLGRRKSILLIDEVEESYDSFAAVVEYETSPLRGLADAAREGRLQAIVLLAFGPSSALKEALFGPVAWRARVIGLPLIGRNYVLEMITRIVENGLAEPMANTAWWMARGRTAWAMFVAENVIPKLVRALGHGVKALADIMSLDPVFESEVVDGVPLLDRNAFNSLAELLGSHVAAVFAAMAGPMPLSMLEKLVGEEANALPSVAVVYAKMGVKVEDALAQSRKVMHRIAKSRDLRSTIVEKASSLLKVILEAWSYNGVLPYDAAALRELVSIAADLAREVYLDEPHVHSLLESVDAALTSLPAVELEEPLVALRPDIIAQLYPPVTSSPLIGCAKHVGFDRVASVVSSIGVEDLITYSSRIAEATGLTDTVTKLGFSTIVFVPSLLRDRVIEKLFCRILEQPTVVITTPPVPHGLRILEELGKTLVVEGSEKLDKMMASLLYGEAVGIESCSVTGLEGRDKRSLQQFTELAKSLILERAGTRRPGRLAHVLEKLQSIVQSLGRLGDIVVSSIASADNVEELVKTVSEVEKKLADVEAILRERLGIKLPLRIEISEAVKEIAKLYDEARNLGLNVLGEMASKCGSELPLSRHNVEHSIDGLTELGKSIESLKELKLDWLPEQLRKSIVELRGRSIELYEKAIKLVEANGSAASLVSASVAGLASTVRAVAQLLTRLENSVRKLVEKTKELPEPVRGQVLARLGARLSQAKTLIDLEKMGDELVREVSAVMELIDEYVSLRRIIESRVEEILEMLSMLEPSSHPHVESSGEEVAA